MGLERGSASQSCSETERGIQFFLVLRVSDYFSEGLKESLPAGQLCLFKSEWGGIGA